MKKMDLVKKAREVAEKTVIHEDIVTGAVGCALIAGSGKVFTGVSINARCGVGFCAEHSAIAQMVTNKEFVIKKIVAVSHDGLILTPCGRCRELMYQISKKNLDAQVVLDDRTVRLRELLPRPWMGEDFDKQY